MPALLKLVVSVDVPETNAAVPSELEPLKNVTVPEAATGVTVAVSVTDEPTTADVVDATSAIVDEVPVAALPLGGCQKSPHPLRRRVQRTAIGGIALRSDLLRILIDPPLGVR